ncbi:MAG TPA: Hsp20/alpha crystallin family protein, partial [Solirubrobacterales bacterium]|nr:Hsp20/alpha crystallin family protein [Solirubrobacterales bacterium]
LAGIALKDVNLEVSGRELVISGERAIQETEGRVYQQVEIDSGPFRRVVELGADVEAEEATASYQDGILRVELPLAEPEDRTRRVPIERSDG